MLSYRYPIIAREGWPALGVVAALVLFSFHYVDPSAAMSPAAVFFLLLFVMRDPPRRVPPLPLAVVAPVDGTVVTVDMVSDTHRQCEVRRISIAMHFLGPYSVRSTIEGKVIHEWHALSREAMPVTGQPMRQRLYYAQWVRTDEGDEVAMAMARSRIFIGPRVYVHSGERVGQGQRCGFVYGGSLIQVLVPVTAKVNVVAGQSVRAGSDILGTIVRT